ncbi:MAG: multi-sensor hybrid histidine kinase [Verrucomicrobia bacterium]|nr:multi-sensor hybrid histidine kinase [Verrucomicrobiota bacterium]
MTPARPPLPRDERPAPRAAASPGLRASRPRSDVDPRPRVLSLRTYRHLVTVWIALSIGGIVMGILVWHQLNVSLEATMENAQFKIELGTVYGLLQDAENSERGYLLSGNPRDLQDFRRAEAAIPGDFARLTEMAQSDPGLLEDVHALHRLAAVKLTDFRRAIEVRRDRGLVAAQAVEPVVESEASRERFLELVARMNRRPSDLFFVRSETTRRQIQRVLVTTIAAGGLGLGAGLLAFYLSRLALRQEKAARELAEQATRASNAAREKSTFLANMSHEIRTPMNAILGFSDLLTSALPMEGKMFHYARSIRDSAHSLLQLINDILDLSKIEAGMVELHLEPTDVRELAAFVRTVFAEQAGRRDLKIEIAVAPAVPPALVLDHSRLRQVLINLAGNAVKFTEHGGVTLRVDWEPAAGDPPKGTLVIDVVDTGVGIPADRLDDVFRPFVQVDPHRKAEQQGTGLGLSIVRRLAEHMGGTVSIESVVGQGTTFHLRFPEIAVSLKSPEGIEGEGEPGADFNDLAPATLLVVDDNAVNRELLAGLFETTHHKVRYAANGREAVDSVRFDGVPSLILMDLRMPRMDGRTAMTEIRKLPNAGTVPMIAVTASSMAEDEPGLRGVFAGYVRKPYTRQHLFQALAALLPGRAQAPANPGVAPAAEAIESVLPEQRERWPELLATLRNIEAAEWPAIRQSGAIFETREFARSLAELGRSHHCPPLIEYAAGVSRDAENYAIASLEKRLDEFPMVIQFILRQVSVPPR